LDSDFPENAKQVLRKFYLGFQSGGGFFTWTAEEREIWSRICALDPLDHYDLHDEVAASLVYGLLPGKPDLSGYERKRAEARERYRELIDWAENLSEAEAGDTLEKRLRWYLGKLLPPNPS